MFFIFLLFVLVTCSRGGRCNFKKFTIPLSSTIEIEHNGQKYTGHRSKILHFFAQITNGEITNQNKDFFSSMGIKFYTDSELCRLLSEMILDFSVQLEVLSDQRIRVRFPDGIIVIIDAR
jgi:hypothetical protein